METKATRDEAERARWLAAAVLVGALALRAAYLLSIRHEFFVTHLVTEPARYDAWARAIASGQWELRPPFDEAPGYPLFVAAVYRVAGPRVLAVLGAQAALDAASCALVAAFARRALGERTAIVAGVLAACFGPTIYFVGQLEPVTLSLFVICAALWATQRSWALGGAAWALALLVRSENVLALPIVLVHAWRIGGRRALVRAAAAPVLVVATSFAVNVASSGEPVLLTTGAGENLWIGNNPDADGVNPFVHGAMRATIADVERRAQTASQADALFRAHAAAFVRAAPGRALGLAAKKLAWTFTSRELPNAIDVEWQLAKSKLFALPFFPLGFGVLFPLAAAGVMLARGEGRKLLLLAAPVCVALVVCVVFFTNARFRVVMAPALVVLAAHALTRALSLRHAGWRAWAMPALAATAAAAWAHSNAYDVRGYRIAEIDDNTAALERGAAHARSRSPSP